MGARPTGHLESAGRGRWRLVANLPPVWRLYAQLAQLGLSERTDHHVDSVLHGMYAWAIEDELLEVNPIKRIKRRRRPRVTPHERRVWSDVQIARAVAAADGLLVRVPLILAAWAGLRRGEVCALRYICCRASAEPLQPDNLSSAWHRFCTNDAATATQEARIAVAMAKVATDSPTIRPGPVELSARRNGKRSK